MSICRFLDRNYKWTEVQIRVLFFEWGEDRGEDQMSNAKRQTANDIAA